MTNKYYSGQGTLYVGERDNAGKPNGLVSVGNVPTLEISIEIEKFEHKESESGNRSVDLTLVQELNGTFSAVLESISSVNLALGFFGESATVTGAAVASEVITIDTKGVAYPLDNVNISQAPAPTAEDSLAASLTLGSDFSVDYENGTVTILDAYAGTIPDDIDFGYTFGDYLRMDAFTQTTVERYLRFHGINTVDDDRVIVDIFRASIDPAQNFALINEELAQLTIAGNILRDALRPSGSEFFTERRLGTQ